MPMLLKGRQWLLSVAIPPWKEPVSYDPGSKAWLGLLVLELEARTFQWMLFRLEFEEVSIMCQSMKMKRITCQETNLTKAECVQLRLASTPGLWNECPNIWQQSDSHQETDESCSGCTAANFISVKEGDPLQVFTISCLNWFFFSPGGWILHRKNSQYRSPKPTK